MVIFFKIFNVFKENKPHKHLRKSYEKINELSTYLYKNLEVFREIQKNLVKGNISLAKYSGAATGGISLKKTEFIEEEFLKTLKKLAKHSEKRFLKSIEEVKKSEPMSPKEEFEIKRIMDYLEKIKKLSDFKKIKETTSQKDKLTLISNLLRDVTNLSREYYEIEKYEESLAREVKEHEITPLLKRIFIKPEGFKHKVNGSDKILVFKVTEKQLRQLEKESEKINSCNDPDYWVEWRKWWKDIQQPEVDKTTPLKDPHINMTLKLFGQKKKDVHLLLENA